MKEFKKTLSKLLVVIMLISMGSTISFGEETSQSQEGSLAYLDMPDNWSTEAIEKAISNGLLMGYNNKIMPNDYVTRAQIAAIINRAFNSKTEANLSSFVDVDDVDWYYTEMAKAVKMATLQGVGNGYLKPEKAVTREEVFKMLGNVLKLSGADQSVLDTFVDKDEISDWAVEAVAALVEIGAVEGYGGMMNPKGTMTRAEIAVIMDKLLENYITESGTYTREMNGNVMVNVAGVVLKDMTISGDLIIGDGVGEGDVTLEDVIVTGRTVIRGGGVNSIKFTGTSKVSKVIIARVDGMVRVYAEDGSEVGEYIADGREDVILEANVESITILASNVTVTAISSKVESFRIIGEASKIILSKGSTVGSGTVEGNNAEVTVSKGSSIGEVTIDGDGAEIGGDGSVSSVKANGANIHVSTDRTTVTAGAQSSNVLADQQSVEKEETVITGGRSSSSNNSGNSQDNDQVDSNNAPVVVNGESSQIGSAVAPSKDGSSMAVAYEGALSTWFEDADNDALTYTVVSATSDGQDVTDHVQVVTSSALQVTIPARLVYTPAADEGDSTTSIVVKANDGTEDSLSVITVTITVKGSEDENVERSNRAPVVVSGQGSQTGSATAPSRDGKIEAVAFESEISTWFEDADGDALTYKVVSATNNGQDVTSHVSVTTSVSLNMTVVADLVYTPQTDEGDNTTEIIVNVNDGKEDSGSAVTIIVTVASASIEQAEESTTQGTMVKLEGDTWVIDASRVSEVYGIWTVEDLQAIETDTEGIYDHDQSEGNYNEKYVLMADIDFEDDSSYRDPANKSSYIPNDDTSPSNEGFKPIGFSYPSVFTGELNGNGNTITHLFINRSNGYVGLFGFYKGKITNLGLIDVNLTGEWEVGGLVSHIQGETGSIEACYVTGDIRGKDQHVGGLVGYNNGSITSSHTSVIVVGNDNAGGLVGANYDGTITASYATGDVTVNGYGSAGGLVGVLSHGSITASYATGAVLGAYRVGGLVGDTENGSRITESYAIGSVTGSDNVGGLVGFANVSSITRSYATGDVTARGSYVGGLVGFNDESSIKESIAYNSSISGRNANRVAGYSSGVVEDNYANKDMTLSSTTNGIVGTDITATQFKTESDYTNLNLNWDFDNIWEIKENADRPTLQGVGEDDGLISID